MLTLTDVALTRGPRVLFEAASWQVAPGQKVGLVGVNGCGKSSLFLMLRGLIEPDRGRVDLPANWQIVTVEQETPALDCPVVDHVIAGDAAYVELLDQREAAENRGGETLARWHQRYETLDGYTLRARASRLLAGLGFSTSEQTRPLATFSGGWRMRVNLARALIQRSDLLLLDEPTNHLDLDAVVWLEQWIGRYTGTLIVIAHDREFLDNSASHIAHIDGRGITTYRGGYSAFERQRAERLAQLGDMLRKQRAEQARLQQFVDRFRAKASKAKQAQSRLKTLQKMQSVAPVVTANQYRFAFPAPAPSSTPLIRFSHVHAGYDDSAILTDIEFELAPGARIGLLGANGSGKSTLMKLLAGVQDPLTGEIERNGKLRTAYFDQQLGGLDPEACPMAHLARLGERTGVGRSEQEQRDFLAGFGFTGERADAAIAPLSGGEKARLALALLVWQSPNLLLLDEPTNHLDLDMRAALTLALQSYEGAVVLVSHDRYLMRAVADDLWRVAAGRVQPFVGDIDDYRKLMLDRTGLMDGENNGESRKSPQSAPQTMPQSRDQRLQRRRAEAEFRREVASDKRRLQVLEQAIESHQKQLDELSVEMADPALYEAGTATDVAGLASRHGVIKGELEKLEVEWLELYETLESRQQAFDRLGQCAQATRE